MTRPGAEAATEALAEFVGGTRYQDLPAAVVHQAKRLTLDVIGNTVGGLRTRLGALVLQSVERAGGTGDAPVLGTAVRTSVLGASYANGRLADALDASDTFMSVHHLGAPCLGALFAMGPAVSGATFLTAVAVGMEVGARIGAAGGPPAHRYSPQPGEPPNIRSGRLPAEELAAAAACAKLLALTPDGVRHGFGAAGTNAARHTSRWGVMPTLPDQKYQDYGVVAMTGAMAALLAASGLTTHPGILDGPWGLWRLYGAPSCDFDLMLRGLGERWLFLDNTYKPWPSCRWTHHGVTLFERLRDTHGLEADQIERVILSPHVYGVAPYFRNTRPRGMVSCEFNHPHALAMAALRVPPGPSWYEPQMQEDPWVAAFRERVEVEADPADSDIERWFVDGQVRRLPTRLRIVARGRQFEATGDYARGDPFGPETMLTDDQLIQKVRDMVAGSSLDDTIAMQTVESIAKYVWQLETTPSIEQLFSLVDFNRHGTPKILE